MDGGDAGDTDKGMVEAVDGKQGAAELPAGSRRRAARSIIQKKLLPSTASIWLVEIQI